MVVCLLLRDTLGLSGVAATLHQPAHNGSEGHLRTAGLAYPAYQYRTPIDYTPIDSGVIANSAARLLGDVPDNTTRPEHPSFTDLFLHPSRPAGLLSCEPRRGGDTCAESKTG